VLAGLVPDPGAELEASQGHGDADGADDDGGEGQGHVVSAQREADGEVVEAQRQAGGQELAGTPGDGGGADLPMPCGYSPSPQRYPHVSLI